MGLQGWKSTQAYFDPDTSSFPTRPLPPLPLDVPDPNCGLANTAALFLFLVLEP